MKRDIQKPRKWLTPAKKLQLEVPFNASAMFWTGVLCFGIAAFIAAANEE